MLHFNYFSIRPRIRKENGEKNFNGNSPANVLNPVPFSLMNDDDSGEVTSFKMTVTVDPYTVTGKLNRTTAGDNVHTFTPSLNPHRLPEIMTPEIFELLESQASLISGAQHKDLLCSTAQNAVLNQNQNQNHPGIILSASFSGLSISNENGNQNTLNYAEILWRDSEARSRVLQKGTGDRTLDLRSASPAQWDSTQFRESGTGTNTGGGSGRPRTASTSRRPIRRSNSKVRGSSAFLSSTGGSQGQGQGMGRGSEIDTERDTPGTGTGTGTGTGEEVVSCRRDDTSVGARDSQDRKEQAVAGTGLNTLAALSTDMLRMVEGGGGMLGGMWFTSHPLQLQPVSLTESLLAVTESKQGQGMSLEKRETWEMDLLREYDEQRMDRYESFLCSKRSPSVEDQLKARTVALGRTAAVSVRVNQKPLSARRPKAVPVPEYYKDRGRQANK